MPDFSVDHTVGFTVADWTDPPAWLPTRLNPLAGLPHRRYTLSGAAVATVELRCVVGGVTGPADAALGGRLFTWAWAERLCPPPYPAPPPLTTVAGSSSILKLTGHPFLGRPGHYLLRCLRPQGGGILLPFEVTP